MVHAVTTGRRGGRSRVVAAAFSRTDVRKLHGPATRCLIAAAVHDGEAWVGRTGLGAGSVAGAS